MRLCWPSCFQASAFVVNVLKSTYISTPSWHQTLQNKGTCCPATCRRGSLTGFQARPLPYIWPQLSPRVSLRREFCVYNHGICTAPYPLYSRCFHRCIRLWLFACDSKCGSRSLPERRWAGNRKAIWSDGRHSSFVVSFHVFEWTRLLWLTWLFS